MTQVDLTNFLSIIEITAITFLFCYGIACFYFFNSFIAKFKVLFRIKIFILIISKLLFKRNLISINTNSI